MSKTIKVFKDIKTKEQYFKLEDFQDIVDISLVDKYRIEKSDGQIILVFYDKDGIVILPKEFN